MCAYASSLAKTVGKHACSIYVTGISSSNFKPCSSSSNKAFINTYPACQPFDPAVPITNSICNIICAAAFGYRFSVDDKDFSELIEAVRVTLKFGGTLYEVFPHIMKYLPGPHQTVKSAYKVYKEIKEVLGSSHSICYQDRKKVPYTNAVIHEIVRSKYILLFGLPRQCVKDVYLGNFLIPKGAILTPDLRSVLFDPEHWETPEEFNPNHFLDKEGNFVPNDAFLPFGAGARVCLGELLAKIETFIMFTSLLREFRFQPPEGEKKLSQKTIIGLTVHCLPYKICALPRINSSQ
ncbi:PREDICTED: cytochrome P450 2J2-like [Thamnophis sirtalis]|uniref:Cytochrome P450 2J2-like n=1 Tax=Thamnophis sirtalis TaxID=35019 RepID=A0A6I9XQZ2_9SAUR|nr:PREDICTED: cytochrome P450 2J2-like [Thamnophis sirtalis]